MLSLSYATSVLLFMFSMLVSVMFAGLLDVALVISAYSAILLISLVWGDIYCNQVVIV